MLDFELREAKEGFILTGGKLPVPALPNKEHAALLAPKRPRGKLGIETRSCRHEIENADYPHSRIFSFRSDHPSAGAVPVSIASARFNQLQRFQEQHWQRDF